MTHVKAQKMLVKTQFILDIRTNNYEHKETTIYRAYLDYALEPIVDRANSDIDIPYLGGIGRRGHMSFISVYKVYIHRFETNK